MHDRYCLQMVACNGGCEDGSGEAFGNIYSTDETVCGTWIDGNIIYRKVIIGTLAEENGTNYVFANVADLKIRRVINLYGNMADNENSASIILQTSYNTPDTVDAAVNMYYHIGRKELLYHLLDSGAHFGCTAYVTLEYIKETNNAS